VTVVIASHNGERFLARAIESVLDQTLEDIELIVVDDTSTDRSAEIAAAYMSSDTRVRLVRRELGSAGAARNVGWRLARAPRVAILDQDDIAYPERLAKQAAFLDAHPEVAVVGGICHVIDAHGHKRGSMGHHSGILDFQGRLAPPFHIVHTTAMIRRSALEEIGGYLEIAGSACEDRDLCLRIGELHPVAWIDVPVGAWRVHGTNSSSKVRYMAEWSLAVQAAHRFRVTGRGDPFDRSRIQGILSADALAGLGISREMLERELFDVHLMWVELAVAMRDIATADIHLRSARNTDLSLSRTNATRYELARARIRLAEHRRADAARAVARGFLLNPIVALRIVKHPVVGGLGRNAYRHLPPSLRVALAPFRDVIVDILNRSPK
jgi:glycosyltransferase involved in cell wall biosynthesis